MSNLKLLKKIALPLFTLSAFIFSACIHSNDGGGGEEKVLNRLPFCLILLL